MKKLQSTNVVTARKLFLKNGTWRSTWLFTQELHGSSANTVRRISLQKLICIVMFHFVATMSFQEFHFLFHNDRRSWRQHFLSMNRGGKADWFNDDLPFLLQGLGPSFCCIHQYWSLKILLVFVFQYGDFGGGVPCVRFDRSVSEQAIKDCFSHSHYLDLGHILFPEESESICRPVWIGCYPLWTTNRDQRLSIVR